MFNLFKDDILR